MRFPKRFEMEGLDPMKLRVQLITQDETTHRFTEIIVENIETLLKTVDMTGFLGPMTGKKGDEWMVRFESSAAYKTLSV